MNNLKIFYHYTIEEDKNQPNSLKFDKKLITLMETAKDKPGEEISGSGLQSLMI
jgi:hypothetical protein